MTAVPDTHFVGTPDGLKIAYQVVGSGSRDIVLIQPLQSVDVIWEDHATAAALDRLARMGRVILLDYRGFGVSDPVPLGALPTPEAWMEDTRVVLDAVGSERATLVALSGSVFLALLFAATYPQRTAGVVIVDGSARLLADDDYPGATLEQLDEIAAFLESAHGSGAVLGSLAAPTLMKDRGFRRTAGRAERLLHSPSTRGTLMRWLATVDVRDVLPAVRVPALIISHPENAFIIREQLEYLALQIEGAELKELPGPDTAFFTEAADQLLDAIEEFVTGAPSAPDDNRVLATVLFADIVGSTDRAVAMGDRRWTELLSQHDAAVRRTVERFRGKLVKTVGDGSVATFDGPARGIRCAEAVRESARQLGLEMRCGLHTGEVELYGDDIAGVGVHVAARVSAVADSGEVLVSSTVKDLVVGSGIEFLDRGEHELKGVPDTWRLFGVRRV